MKRRLSEKEQAEREKLLEEYERIQADLGPLVLKGLPVDPKLMERSKELSKLLFDDIQDGGFNIV